jgi:hypothetical protein
MEKFNSRRNLGELFGFHVGRGDLGLIIGLRRRDMERIVVLGTGRLCFDDFSAMLQLAR